MLRVGTSVLCWKAQYRASIAKYAGDRPRQRWINSSALIMGCTMAETYR